MCMCDDKYFKVTNVTTGKTKMYKRAASIASRFDTSRDLVFHMLRSGDYIYHNRTPFKIEKNEHIECRELRNKIRIHFNKNPSYLTMDQIRWYQEHFARSDLNFGYQA